MQNKKLEIKNLSVRYNGNIAINNLCLDIYENEVFAIIGPANSGKSSLLKCINRMTDFISSCKIDGDILMNGESIWKIEDATELRRKVGMVSPLPVGLPMSIKDNVTYAPRMNGVTNKDELEALMIDCLQKASLWDEVKDRLGHLATKLSGGQQQRLTIARALSHRPEILCLDEFSIAIDPVTTSRIEEVIKELKKNMTVVLVTNVISQAKRLGDKTCMMLESNLLDVASTSDIFAGKVNDKRTTDYINGIFG
jgi:phosphate transport system ATP-binding protein